ncbi:MAG: endonuclease Q family protein [Caldimicrobium sp.]|nr:endonuclease Q family protein [Caldimicrobium sp.]MCX7612830.1 endonuclease Q family protein [Caldimicrobium sp.]MDW8183298.1 endonuclease Q family protein [Caldimicrobium sp.]
MKNQKLPSLDILQRSFIADLHIHSKFSRASSKNMDPKTLSKVGKLKGIQLIGTGDFTHPLYLKELKEYLEYEPESGFYFVKGEDSELRFVPSAEISLIFSQDNKSNRRMHLILLAPDFEVVEEINLYLSKLGNLSSDGRPTFGISAERLTLDLVSISPYILIIPAHAWTPWYSLFGAFSGFDSIEEAFGEATPYIYAIETGLSSDPEMNWRISRLDGITLLSNSDAHSPWKIGREATAFFYPFSFENLYQSIKKGQIAYTIEFYPEEGKYHLDGHRTCKVVLTPKETKELGYKCPKCGQNLTIGVLHRVEILADRPEEYHPHDKPYSVHLVPLMEIMAQVFDLNLNSKTLERLYVEYVTRVGTEFDILLKKDLQELASKLPETLVLAINKVRNGQVFLKGGYDGVYGEVKIFENFSGEERTFFKQKSIFPLG